MLELKDVVKYIPSKDAKAELLSLINSGLANSIYSEREIYTLYLRYDPDLSLSTPLLKRIDKYQALYEIADDTKVRYDIACIIRYYNKAFKLFKLTQCVSDFYVISNDEGIIDIYGDFDNIDMSIYDASNVTIYQVPKDDTKNMLLDDIYEVSHVSLNVDKNGEILIISDDSLMDAPMCRNSSWYVDRYVYIPCSYSYGDFVKIIYNDEITYGISMVSSMQHYHDELIEILQHIKLHQTDALHDVLRINDISTGISSIPILSYCGNGMIWTHGNELTRIEKVDKDSVPLNIRTSLNSEFSRIISESALK